MSRKHENPMAQTYWQRHAEPSRCSLASNLETDVLIIGGGIVGLSAADAFSRAGKKVVVVEKEYIGSGASGKSSGIISQDSELELTDLIRNLGKDEAKKLWEFVSNGMNQIKNNITTHGISCDYQMQDYVFLAKSRDGVSKVAREMKSRELLGYESTVYAEKDIKNLIDARGYKGALRYPGTFGINSYAYVYGMREILATRGVSFYEKTNIVTLENNTAYTENDVRVKATTVVVCVDRLLPALAIYPRDVYQVETYLTISKPLATDDAKRLFPSGNVMAADSDLIYQYFRITGENRLLLGGGDYITTYAREESDPKRILRKLRAYVHHHFPHVDIDFDHVWPGLLGVSKDLVPLAGKVPGSERTYFVAAATGLAWGTALGTYVSEMALQNRNDYDHLFSPTRHFPFDPLMRLAQWIITTPMAFGLSHAYSKYLR